MFGLRACVWRLIDEYLDATFSDSGNEFLLTLGKCFETFQCLLACDLLFLRAFDFNVFLTISQLPPKEILSRRPIPLANYSDLIKSSSGNARMIKVPSIVQIVTAEVLAILFLFVFALSLWKPSTPVLSGSL